MSFIMNMSTKAGCLCLILLTLMKGVFLLTCGFSNFNESLSKEEKSFININYTINDTTSPDVTDTFNAQYEVCEGNSVKTACRFIHYKDYNTEFKKYVSGKTGLTCYWEQRHVSSSVVALDIYISQVVTRSLSAMIFTTGRGGIPKSTRLIRVEVLYPPKVTSLTVGGEDFTSPYFINEGQKVDIFCSFDKGNPPDTFKLLDKHKHELKSAGSDGYLNYSLTAQCEDYWPIVRCEGSGSKQNRSVTFLVRCPPQFVENSMKIVNLQTFQVLTFRVKTYTTLVACLLTPVGIVNNVTRGVGCILSGHPPDLLLTVHLNKESNISQGNWSLIFRNEIGSATTTLIIIYDPGGFSNFTESLSKEEHSSININYTINFTTSPDVTRQFKCLIIRFVKETL
ncbi:uncharacterized protein LOC112569669 [Pomacea canaliculata]|uniref:uncharacterized protein LOC112569669 n=1 Tax=Pomacea canaliculata TaxID=400727 RepID=UPI000D7275ED|nr:uncharacterized protein LOC112569669 [Pomacea canaliculata]